MYYKLDSKCSVPPISLYTRNCKIPKFRTFVNLEFVELELSQIDNTNEHGQEVNDARAQGTDKINVDGLRSSFLTKGVDTSIVPPIVIREKSNDGKHFLSEGFSRYAAHLLNEQNSIIVLVGDIAEGCDIEDVKDELGLGCNDHLSSKKATTSDFETRLSKYIDRTENATEKMCYEWFDGIENSLTDTKKNNIVNKVFAHKNASKTMESFDSKSKGAQNRVKQLTKIDIKNIVVFNNKTGASFETMLSNVMKYRQKFGKMPKIYGYLNGVSAKDAHKERVNLINKVVKYNQTIRSIVQEANSVQLKDFEENDEIYEFLTLDCFIPQMLNEETEIIPVDKI
jgi:hypothetical protein